VTLADRSLARIEHKATTLRAEGDDSQAVRGFRDGDLGTLRQVPPAEDPLEDAARHGFAAATGCR
jgi:hypothetical protein